VAGASYWLKSDYWAIAAPRVNML
ncbi:uncharacterized protein METZ01_LOCUS111915, partial [marine metagenome]